MLVSKRTQRGLTYGVGLTAMLGLAFAGWTHLTPASAQDTATASAPAQAPNGRGGGMRMGPTSIAASGDFIYVLRGNTLYQLKSSDLSVNSTKDLPAAEAAPAAPAAGGAGQ